MHTSHCIKTWVPQEVGGANLAHISRQHAYAQQRVRVQNLALGDPVCLTGVAFNNSLLRWRRHSETATHLVVSSVYKTVHYRSKLGR